VAAEASGVLIHNAQADFDVTGVYAGLLVATAIARAAEGTLSALERQLILVDAV
jgi:ABC-type nitrate/sulfonate/bicarbonate transport system permease component